MLMGAWEMKRGVRSSRRLRETAQGACASGCAAEVLVLQAPAAACAAPIGRIMDLQERKPASWATKTRTTR